jgi:hypothetical protein
MTGGIGHIPFMGEGVEMHAVFWLGILQERGNLRNPVVGGNTKLKRILNSVRLGGRDSFGPELGKRVGSCKRSNEPSGSVKCMEFLD